VVYAILQCKRTDILEQNRTLVVVESEPEQWGFFRISTVRAMSSGRCRHSTAWASTTSMRGGRWGLEPEPPVR